MPAAPGSHSQPEHKTESENTETPGANLLSAGECCESWQCRGWSNAGRNTPGLKTVAEKQLGWRRTLFSQLFTFAVLSMHLEYSLISISLTLSTKEQDSYEEKFFLKKLHQILHLVTYATKDLTHSKKTPSILVQYKCPATEKNNIPLKISAAPSESNTGLMKGLPRWFSQGTIQKKEAGQSALSNAIQDSPEASSALRQWQRTDLSDALRGHLLLFHGENSLTTNKVKRWSWKRMSSKPDTHSPAVPEITRARCLLEMRPWLTRGAAWARQDGTSSWCTTLGCICFQRCFPCRLRAQPIPGLKHLINRASLCPTDNYGAWQ